MQILDLKTLGLNFLFGHDIYNISKQPKFCCNFYQHLAGIWFFKEELGSTI